jgi:hypothetical protein
MRLIFLLLFQFTLFASHFDCIFIGSSPFSLFEALYQNYSGKTVLVLEEAASCGGAWKGIDILGVKNVDLGCHQVGHDIQLKTFLEEYAGCHIVSMDHPLENFSNANSPNGWYFSQGCYELIGNLLKLISQTNIVILNSHKAVSATIDSLKKIATVEAEGKTFTTSKLLVTPMSRISLFPNHQAQNFGKSKHYHLYMLVADPTPPKFSYVGGVLSGASRVMNLTHFTGLSGTGKHLVVVQVHGENQLRNGDAFIQGLIKQKLLDPSASLLKSESYIYESGSFHQGVIAQAGGQGIVEVLQTGHFLNLGNYVSKWKQVLKPYPF